MQLHANVRVHPTARGSRFETGSCKLTLPASKSNVTCRTKAKATSISLMMNETATTMSAFQPTGLAGVSVA